MSDKVKLKMEVADAIEHFRSLGHENSSIVYMFASGMNYDNMTAKTLADYASDNFDSFLKALVNGYEVEPTPEDKVRDYYKSCEELAQAYPDSPTFDLNTSLMRCVREVCTVLGHKIQGVNAE